MSLNSHYDLIIAILQMRKELGFRERLKVLPNLAKYLLCSCFPVPTDLDESTHVEPVPSLDTQTTGDWPGLTGCQFKAREAFHSRTKQMTLSHVLCNQDDSSQLSQRLPTSSPYTLKYSMAVRGPGVGYDSTSAN